MVLETMVYMQFNHLMQLVASKGFIEGLSKKTWDWSALQTVIWKEYRHGRWQFLDTRYVYTKMPTSWSLFNTKPQTSRDKLFAKYAFHISFIYTYSNQTNIQRSFKNKINTMFMRTLLWLQHMHGTQTTDGTLTFQQLFLHDIKACIMA
jgi:hypothetical protein